MNFLFKSYVIISVCKNFHRENEYSNYRNLGNLDLGAVSRRFRYHEIFHYVQ